MRMPKDTKPEQILNEHVIRLNLPVRRHDYSLPGRPDFVLQDVRIVAFVHGCYRHRHSACPASRSPRTQPFYWIETFRNTVARDQKNVAALTAAGWWVFIAWECELYANPDDVAGRLDYWYRRRLEVLGHGLTAQ